MDEPKPTPADTDMPGGFPETPLSLGRTTPMASNPTPPLTRETTPRAFPLVNVPPSSADTTPGHETVPVSQSSSDSDLTQTEAQYEPIRTEKEARPPLQQQNTHPRTENDIFQSLSRRRTAASAVESQQEDLDEVVERLRRLETSTIADEHRERVEREPLGVAGDDTVRPAFNLLREGPVGDA